MGEHGEETIQHYALGTELAERGISEGGHWEGRQLRLSCRILAFASVSYCSCWELVFLLDGVICILHARSIYYEIPTRYR